jgi:hypothetical protein
VLSHGRLELAGSRRFYAPSQKDLALDADRGTVVRLSNLLRWLLISMRARTLRLAAEQAEALEAIAGVDELSVNEEIRRAIAALIEARRRDSAFQERLAASINRNKEILERLSR